MRTRALPRLVPRTKRGDPLRRLRRCGGSPLSASRVDFSAVRRHRAAASCTHSAWGTATVGLKAWNVPKLAAVWALNVVLFWLAVTDVVGDEDFLERLRVAVSGWGSVLAHTALYAALHALVVAFNGLFARPVKECLVFWPASRPGARAFSHFLHQDSTIDRSTLEERFAPFPSGPKEQNALWVQWLHELEGLDRIRSAYAAYLFGRDWMIIAVVTLVGGSAMALLVAANATQVPWYILVLVLQCVLVRRLARVQGEQLVLSVLASKASSLAAGAAAPPKGKGSAVA